MKNIEKTNLFNRFFATNLAQETEENLPIVPNRTVNLTQINMINVEEANQKLSQIKCEKAAGSDGSILEYLGSLLFSLFLS